MEFKSLAQECTTRVSRSVSQECPKRVFRKSVPQEWPTRVSYKSVPQEITRASYKFPKECPTRVSQVSVSHPAYKSVLQECPTRGDTLVDYCATLLWGTLVGHCKTSVSYETSSNSQTSSLQTSISYETSSKNSHLKAAKRATRTVKCPRRAFRTRRPPKVTCQSLQNKQK